MKDSTIFGIYPVEEALKNVYIDKVFVQQGVTNEKILELLARLEASQVSIQHVPIEKLNKLTKGNHQGIVALTSPIAFTPLEILVETAIENKIAPIFLILDRISDVRNFGAILRTAECTGVDGIIIPQSGAAPIGGDAVKTSVGAIYNLPIAKVAHIKDAIYYLQASGVTIFAATEKTDLSLYEQDFTKPLALIMGSEGKGITPSVLQLADHKAALPLLGKINSLNVSVACGAFLYEIVRQRQ